MASKIRVLSEQTINQIAAGEVIENPASVVKELVENAIDACAKQVTIEIFAGGFQSIKITDDGSGMSPDDAVLSLERHATSKIFSTDDLLSLSTMGFRGEALASIAAISKMTLTTALENSPAIALEMEGGKISHVGPAARTRGTTIEIRSLFYNVPARKKFQKSAAASSSEITKIITQLALAHPEIGIELIQQGRSLFSLPSSSGEDFLSLLKRRAKVLLNEEFLLSTYPFELKEGQCTGEGLIADPLIARHNRSGQYLFVNRRPVYCPAIAYAIRDAYGTRLASDRHPVYLLHLSIASALVDVNVHPQKKEIRLREESMLKYAIHSAVNAALGGQLSSQDFSLSASIPMAAFAETSRFSYQTASDFTGTLPLREELNLPSHPEIALTHELQTIGLHGNYLLIDARSLSTFFPLGSERHCSGIVFADLPAIEARVQFDSLIKHAHTLPLSQGLLMPLTLSFSRADTQLLNANAEVVGQLGLQVRQIGDTVFLIEAIPPFLEEGEIQKILEELICELQGLEKEKSEEQKRLHKLSACICRRMRSRRKAYCLSEAVDLMHRLLRSSDPRHCPQGKLTLFQIKEEEIENYFTTKSRPGASQDSF